MLLTTPFFAVSIAMCAHTHDKHRVQGATPKKVPHSHSHRTHQGILVTACHTQYTRRRPDDHCGGAIGGCTAAAGCCLAACGALFPAGCGTFSWWTHCRRSQLPPTPPCTTGCAGMHYIVQSARRNTGIESAGDHRGGHCVWPQPSPGYCHTTLLCTRARYQ